MVARVVAIESLVSVKQVGISNKPAVNVTVFQIDSRLAIMLDMRYLFPGSFANCAVVE